MVVHLAKCTCYNVQCICYSTKRTLVQGSGLHLHRDNFTDVKLLHCLCNLPLQVRCMVVQKSLSHSVSLLPLDFILSLPK